MFLVVLNVNLLMVLSWVFSAEYYLKKGCYGNGLSGSFSIRQGSISIGIVEFMDLPSCMELVQS